MALRAIASLSLAFGLVSIPVRLYSAAERSAVPRFKLMGRAGARLRQRYVVDALPEAEPALDVPPASSAPAPGRSRTAEPPAAPARVAGSHAAKPAQPVTAAADVGTELARHQMARGYEYEKGKYVLFSEDELQALRTPSSDHVHIVAFVPQGAVEPIHYDKAYLLAPGPAAERSYRLLWRALQRSGRSALASWAWKGRDRIVEIRAAAGGLVLQQLFHADELRTFDALHIDTAEVGEAEMRLALQLIEQHARERFDAREFSDAGKQRILDAVQRKIAGHETVSHVPAAAETVGGDVVDLLQALRDSLQGAGGSPASTARRPVARAKSGGAVGRPDKAAKTPR